MNHFAAFAMGEANRHKPMMVFDWVKAAELIKERQPSEVRAGLAGDWEYIGGTIWEDGKPVPKEDTYVFLSSTWATPQIEIDGETYDCFKYQDDTPNWDSGTYFPPESLAILGLPESV